MIVTVRRWTSVALPRLGRRVKANRLEEPKQNQVRTKPRGFLESFEKMFEYQANLMFKEDLDR